MDSRLARVIIFLVILISVGAGFILPRLEFDYDFEAFFPADDPDLITYQQFRDQFSSDNDFLLIGIENEAGIFQQDFLLDIERLTDSLETVKFVTDVYSPTRASKWIMGPLGPIEVPYLHVDDPERYASDSTLIYEAEQMRGSFFGADGTSVAFFVMHEPYISKAKSDTLAKQMGDLLATFDFDRIRISGRTVGQQYYIETMQSELVLFVGLGIIILVILLAFSFRTFWGVWVPLSVVFLSALWLLAFMHVTGKPIDIMSTLLPTILFVVGISDVVHLLSRYLEELRKGKEKAVALRITIKEIGLATFLTSLTTAIGFLTLLTANINPVREFGLYMAVGVFIAFLLAFTFFPAILQLHKTPAIAQQSTPKLFWYKQMHRLLRWNLRNKKMVLIGGLVLTAVSLSGIGLMQVNSYLLEDLAEDDPQRQNFIFFEEQYSGVRPFEMALYVTDSTQTLFDYEVLVELDKIETYLKEVYDVGFSTSALTMVKTANQATNGGKQEHYRLPESEAGYKKLRRIIRQLRKRPEFRAMVSANEREGRISGRIVDLGSKAIEEKNEALLRDLNPQVDASVLQFQLTGMPLLIDKNNEELAANMLYGLLIAFGVIALIMGLLFRSLKMVIITLFPNILPLLVIGGFMGFMGIDLNATTAIIFTIAFGIAVDDTIHFMSKLRLELNKGKSMLYALKRTSISTGKAIVVTSLVLCSGFVTLTLSTFSSTYYVGLLISITLAAAVFADLVVLPVLIVLFNGKTKG